MHLIQGPPLSRREFCLRSFTWGLPVTLAGAFAALCMLLTGHRAHRFHQCIRFEVGQDWGGGSIGPFLFTCRDASPALLAHELGHAVQNCYYGPFMPFLVSIPSSSRFWFRKLLKRCVPGIKLSPYDSAWFEGEATNVGRRYVEARLAERRP